MSIISIEGMRFHAYHGCFKEEQIVGTGFELDIRLEVDTAVSEESDRLEDTLDYQSVYLLIKQEMEVPSKLLEHVGRRILDRLKDEYKEITSAQLKISKMNPPLGGQMKSVGLTLNA